MFINKKPKGFTLLELLVVTGIILFFSGLAFASFNFFGEEKKLDEQAKQLVSVLNSAFKKASSGEDPGCNYFQGYRVRIPPAASSYLFQTCCSQDWSCSTQANTLQTYNLPSNFTITTNRGSSVNILFKKLASGVVINQDTSINNIIVRICNSNTNKYIPITIESSGLVIEGNKTANCP